MDLIFLGTGAGGGVPVFYCGCKVCREAIRDSRFCRTRCSVVLSGNENLLFDCPPEISRQLLREKISTIDHLFVTHTHHDHTAGLGDLAIYVRFFKGGRLPAVMSAETLRELKRQIGEVEDWLEVKCISPGENVKVNEVMVTALAVSHGPGTFGYLIEADGAKTAYIPDTGPLPNETMQCLVGVDRLILDSTFFGENWYPEEHLSISEAIAIGRELDVGRLYLTHLSMHYSKPVTNKELDAYLRDKELDVYLDGFAGAVSIAYDGLRIDVSQIEKRGFGRVPGLDGKTTKSHTMQTVT